MRNLSHEPLNITSNYLILPKFGDYTGGCSVLYANASDNIMSNSLTYLWSLANNTKGVALSGLGPARDTLLTNLSSVSPSQPALFAYSNFTYASNASVYALVQCFGILNSSRCAQCLSLMTSSGVLDTLGNATEGLIYYGSCFAQFSSSPFYSGPLRDLLQQVKYMPCFHHRNIRSSMCMCMCV